jgi:hypothetical protein
MSKAKNNIIVLFLWLALPGAVYSQTGITLEEVIALAKEHAFEYREVENEFLSDYISYRHYKTNLLPRINLTANPFSINRSLTERYDFGTNIETFRESKTLSSNSSVSISQKIPVTGGTLSLGSNLSRIENFGELHLTSYNIIPFRIGLSQSLFAHNPYHWEKREMPLKLKLAKGHLLQSEQKLNQQVTQLYFSLLKAFQMEELAQQEVKNSDTLLNAGKTLLEINAITPNELIELELKNTKARVLLATKKQELADARFEMNKILRWELSTHSLPVLVETIPELLLSPEKLIELARASNPFYTEMEQELINIQKRIDQAEKQNGFSVNLNFGYGLNQGGTTLKDTRETALHQQTGSVTLSIPVFNWGENRDILLLARQNSEMSGLKIQTKIEVFEQNIVRKAVENNLNREMIENASIAKGLALKVYNTKIQQYKIGEITLQELNQTQLDLLHAKEDHLESITEFWINYYELQQITLHDLKTNRPLTSNFDQLIDMFYNR